MKKLVCAGVVLGLMLVAGQVGAQGTYRGPDCELSTGHFLVNSGVVYLKGATEEADPVKRARMLADAERNLTQAVDQGQADNPAVWYFLGRYYFAVNDPAGADSAFGRAERLAPQCAQDITFYRQSMWVPLVNGGIDSMRSGAYEGAKEQFRQANSINQKDNVAFFYLASIFGNEGEVDSALHYFKQVVEIGPADTARVDNYVTSLANVAILFHMTEQWDSAAVWYRKVRDRNPQDTDALLGLAEAHAAMGNEEMTLSLYDSVLAQADMMDDLDLFDTGVKLFTSERYDMASKAFQLGLEKNPYHRDALYNLANTQLAVAQDQELPRETRTRSAQQLEAIARRLIRIDPYNRGSLRLLAAGHQLQRHDDSTLAALERVEQLAFEVLVETAQRSDGGYSVSGTIANTRERATEYPAIRFEFLDRDGNVVVTEQLAAGSLPMHGKTAFDLTAKGENIVAWRYRAES